MRENYRNSIASIKKFPQLTTMNVIDGQAGLIICASLIFYSLTIDNILNIILLLILAGISISMLSGDNGLLKRAGDARGKTVEGQEKEQVELAYISAAVKKLGNDVTKAELQIELNNSVGPGKTDVSADDNNLNVLFIDTEHNYTVDNNGNVEVYIKPEPITVAKAKTDGTVFTTKTTLIDDYNNKIIIPKGFKIAPGDEGSATNVAGGIVIEDASYSETLGSQFVWIPIGTINISLTEKKTILLGRYEFNSSTGTPSLKQEASKTDYKNVVSATKANGYDFYEYDTDDTTFDNTKAKNLGEFITSTINNGGYYIARYEAGINETVDNYSLETKTATDGSIKPLSKKGLGVWNLIMQSEASKVSQCMYNYSGLTSDLINSYAWDTAIVFIQTCGLNGDDSANYSIQWGDSAINYKNRQLTGTNTLKIQLRNGTKYIRTTPILDEQCKICDMAGNTWEWSTETWGNATYPCVGRGGAYSQQSGQTRGRGQYQSVTFKNIQRVF